MSKTIRKIIGRGGEEKEVDDTQASQQVTVYTGHKMTPYAKKRKYPARTRMYQVPGHDRKEMVRNANRSLKKAIRQQYKKELQESLEELDL